VPSDTFSHSVTVQATPESIDAALQRPDTWRGIGPIDEIWDATHEGASLTGFKWRARAAGRPWEGTAERLAHTASGAIAFGLDSSEIAGSITVVLEPNGATTGVTVRLSAQSKGFLASMFWGVVADALRRGLPSQVEAFGEQF